MIQYGVCAWCMDRRGVDVIERIAEFGLTCTQIEIRDDDSLRHFSDPATQAAYVKAAHEHGVAITALALNLFVSVDGILYPDGSPERAAALAIVRQGLAIARAMRIPIMHIPSFGRSEIKNDADLALTADFFHQACVITAGSGVQMATENPMGLDGHRRLFDLANHPDLRILVDTCNPVLRGNSATDPIEHMGAQMCNQVHVKDARKGVKGSVPLGEGDGEFAHAARVLCTTGFSGYVISENNYKTDTERLLTADMAVLHRSFG